MAPRQACSMFHNNRRWHRELPVGRFTGQSLAFVSKSGWKSNISARIRIAPLSIPIPISIGIMPRDERDERGDHGSRDGLGGYMRTSCGVSPEDRPNTDSGHGKGLTFKARVYNSARSPHPVPFKPSVSIRPHSKGRKCAYKYLGPWGDHFQFCFTKTNALLGI